MMGVRYVYRHGKRIEVETLPDLPGVISMKQKRQQRKNFVHEDMETLILGFDLRSRLWAYLLQRRRIQPGKPLAVSNIRMATLGIHRFVKMRALRSLERAGLIRVLRACGKNPRVEVLK